MRLFIAALTAFLVLTGCSGAQKKPDAPLAEGAKSEVKSKDFHLDFGGDDSKAFEWKWSWRADKPAAQPDSERPPFEVPPEVEATYAFPDVHAGLNVVLGSEDTRITPTLGIEIAEFKVPGLRWFNIQAQGGAQLLDVYVGKRFTSIFEITAGGWFGYDFEEKDQTWGVGFTLTKF